MYNGSYAYSLQYCPDVKSTHIKIGKIRPPSYMILVHAHQVSSIMTEAINNMYELMFHIVVLPDLGALADINGFVYLNLRCSGSKHNLHKKPAMEPLSVPICR